MALTATAAVAAGAVAVSTYLDGKYQLRRDLDSIIRLRGNERAFQKAVKENRLSFWYAFEETASKYANNQAIWTRDGTYTFAEVRDLAIRYASWFLEQGIQPGELIGLYIINSAEFMILWLACLCIGCSPAFINYNLEGNALLHCLKVCETKILLVDVDNDCQRRINGSRQQIESQGTKLVRLDELLKQKVATRPLTRPGDEYRQTVTAMFPVCLIYTSGTTGLPKGCAFTTQRLWQVGPHRQASFDSKPGVDCWYNSMPLYHGTGSMSAIAQLLCGVRIAIGRKFTVSRFWDDICDSESTFFVYVGETARYLLNAPPHPRERDHQLRCCYGNGMRPDVWEKLRQRFNIPEVAEFFNSTEGMFGLVNYDRGSYLSACVGHHGLIMRTLLRNVYIPIKIDHETGDIWRDPKTTLAQRASYDEGGEMIVAIPSKEAFQGYWKNGSATDKKFCKDVFKKGDIYYRSGDALRRDDDGKWHFLDRLGDTFRWKSENVSTAEVAECIGKYPGIAEANVYGVLVPNHEGRAGCAAIHLDPTSKEVVNYNELLRYTRQRLPKYAIPVFLRIVKTSTHIHNHKQNKVPLRKEGVDPKLVGSEVPTGRDDVILWSPTGDTYVDFRQHDWEAIESRQSRL